MFQFLYYNNDKTDAPKKVHLSTKCNIKVNNLLRIFKFKTCSIACEVA